MSNFQAFASNQCPNKLLPPTVDVPLPLSLSLTRLCLRPSFSRWNPSLPRFHPLLSTFYEASLRIQTRQPSTSTTIHRRRLRRLTLLEMQRLRRMFENVFSPSFLLSLSLFSPGIYIYVYSPRVPREGNPAMTDGNLATDLLPEMLTKCSRVPPCRERWGATFIPPFFVFFARDDDGTFSFLCFAWERRMDAGRIVVSILCFDMGYCEWEREFLAWDWILDCWVNFKYDEGFEE